MMGDPQDMLGRLRAALPARWFPDQAQVLDAMLSGVAWAWSWCYGIIEYVRAQTRISTASDIWLDVIAADFFGGSLARRAGEDDDLLRRRILRELFRDRATRAALADVLIGLTGRAPLTFEPARATDTGGYGGSTQHVTGCAYGGAGGWGSLNLPFQCFVQAFRPTGSGIALIAGWGTQAGGYGIGTEQYASLSMIQGQVTDPEISQAVASVMPAASIAWLRIGS